MGIPAGGEIAIYDDPNLKNTYRIAMGLDYPALVATFQDLFGAPLDPVKWAFSEYGGPPLVTGGKATIRMFGGAPLQWFYTRPCDLPDDPTMPFVIAFTAAFPLVDPIYSQVITVGTIDSDRGGDAEPFRITQHGSMRYGDIIAADIGKLWFSTAGAYPSPVTNDHADHDYVIEWDGAGNVRITVDTVEIFNDAGPRPYYVAAGLPQQTEKYDNATAGRIAASLSPNDAYTALVGGDVSAPTTLTAITMNAITITPDSAEVRVRPGWTTPNIGGLDIDSAPDGMLYEADDLTWAKLPRAQIIGWTTAQGLSLAQISDTASIRLAIAHSEDPDGVPNLFTDTRWRGMPVTIDAQVSTDAGDAAAWVRLFAGYIRRVTTNGEAETIELDLIDRPTSRLDVFLARGYTNVEPIVSAQKGAKEARSGLPISGPDVDGYPFSILTDLGRVSDSVAGGPLGPVPWIARLLDHAPVMFTTGGSSFLPVVQEIVDRCGLEWWRKYAVSGDARYGEHIVNARTIEGSAGWTFRGKGASGGHSNAYGIRIIEDDGDGPGSMFMRNDSSAVREVNRNTELLAILGTFPLFAYPPTARTWEDSFAMLSGFGLTSLVILKDAANVNVTGGVANHRYQAENAQRRKGELRANNQIWIEPTDIVGLDDVRTNTTPAEGWVVENVIRDYTAGGPIVVTAHVVTTDWRNAIRYGRPL